MKADKDIRQQFADTMLEVGQADSRLVVVIGDISHFKLQPFAEACPGRFYNIGILEPTMISMSAGLSKVGFLPVVHTIAPFIAERSLEQLKLDFGYQALPGNIVTVGSAFDYSNLGCSHHCYSDFALFKSIPTVQVTFPASALEFDLLFKQSFDNAFLTTFRIPAQSHGVEWQPEEVKFGKGIRVTEGADVTVVVTGPQLKGAIEAHRSLARKGLGVEIVYLHTIRPFDGEIVASSISKTRKVVVVEEHQRTGGIGQEVLEIAHGIGGVRFASLCLPEAFVREYRSYEGHCSGLGLDAEGIVNSIESLLR